MAFAHQELLKGTVCFSGPLLVACRPRLKPGQCVACATPVLPAGKQGLWLRPRCMTQGALVLHGHITDVSTLSIPVFAALESQPAGQLAGPRHLQPAGCSVPRLLNHRPALWPEQTHGVCAKPDHVTSTCMSSHSAVACSKVPHARSGHLSTTHMWITSKRWLLAVMCLVCPLWIQHARMHADTAIVSLLSPATLSQRIYTRTLGELSISQTLTE